MAQAVARALLQGAAAIELQDIDPGAAAGYLTRTQLDPAPRGWQELTSRLRQEPGSPLARALSNPLMLTLVRDTYRAGDDAGELLSLRDAAGHPASSEDIAGHLLDRVLPAAYTQQPGEPPARYDLATAERALRCLAARMNKDGTRDLQWWHVPAWAHAAPRVIATWLGAVLVVGFVAGLAWGLAFGFGKKIPKRMAPVRWRQLFRRRPLVAGLLTGIVAVLVFGRGVWLAPGIVVWLAPGLAVGLVAWLGAGLVAGMSRPGTDNTSPLSPLSSWRSDRAYGLAVGIVVGIVIEFGFGLWAMPAAGPGTVIWALLATELGVGLAFGLGIGLVVWLVYPQSWSSFLSFAQLAASDRTPLRLMRFLEDARSRSVLRTVGPVYQFRHARLQDRLATQEPAAEQGTDEPRLAAAEV